MRKAVQGCRGCDLFKNATQAVFGEGPLKARFVLVGEQPGNQEDLQGHPFVGASGKLLDRALAEAGIPREEVYVTNAVKHFKWVPRGKIRLHSKPRASEIQACRPWLESELGLLQPLVIVCLGTTAGHAVFGHPIKVGELRGKFVQSEFCEQTTATPHPSALLRIPKADARRQAFQELVRDLKRAYQRFLAKQ